MIKAAGDHDLPDCHHVLAILTDSYIKEQSQTKPAEDYENSKYQLRMESSE